MLVFRRELTGRYVPGGHVRLVRSDLDFEVIRRGGATAKFDAKTFDSPHFDYSELLQKKEPQTHQIDRAVLYSEWGIPSGFLVWFRPINRVVFYAGSQVACAGPGSRFRPETGLSLGGIESFDLRRIFLT